MLCCPTKRCLFYLNNKSTKGKSTVHKKTTFTDTQLHHNGLPLPLEQPQAEGLNTASNQTEESTLHTVWVKLLTPLDLV